MGQKRTKQADLKIHTAKTISTRAGHTPVWQPVSVSLPISNTHRKSQILGF
ncbi:hypothetical protein F383_16220 [Gossypium arboreum]|uniref:Uncharacterized protein n=1 Tax=Gossypium arboreum TaxID=29729 RepID=A0A0B0PYD0_GOSAR|nr:hypothetical protein F383_16220 [Gossypium arboreum]